MIRNLLIIQGLILGALTPPPFAEKISIQAKVDVVSDLATYIGQEGAVGSYKKETSQLELNISVSGRVGKEQLSAVTESNTSTSVPGKDVEGYANLNILRTTGNKVAIMVDEIDRSKPEKPSRTEFTAEGEFISGSWEGFIRNEDVEIQLTSSGQKNWNTSRVGDGSGGGNLSVEGAQLSARVSCRSGKKTVLRGNLTQIQIEGAPIACVTKTSGSILKTF